MLETETNWEHQIYDEIISTYERNYGIDLTSDPFVYQEIIKLMEMLKTNYGDDKEKLKDVITNALILLVSLFFDKNDEDDGNGRPLTPKEQAYLKKMLVDAIDFVSSNEGMVA